MQPKRDHDLSEGAFQLGFHRGAHELIGDKARAFEDLDRNPIRVHAKARAHRAERAGRDDFTRLAITACGCLDGRWGQRVRQPSRRTVRPRHEQTLRWSRGEQALERRTRAELLRVIKAQHRKGFWQSRTRWQADERAC